MDYLVSVSGNVINKQEKTYVISATSKEEALDTANQSFGQEYEFVDIKSNIKPYNRTIKAVIALLFFFVAILLSCFEWWVGHDSVLIRPNYISTLYSVLFYSAFVVRFKGVQRLTSSWIDVVSCIGMILLLSSFVQTMLFSGTLNFFGLAKIEVDMKILLPIAIIFSWIGLKFISIVCMIAILVLSLFSIASLSEAMGAFWGTVYVLSSFLGIIFYLSIEPVAIESLSRLKSFAHHSLVSTQHDFSNAKQTISQLAKKQINTNTISDNNTEMENKK